MENNIEKELKGFLLECCGIDFRNVDKNDNLYLHGMMPRDMVKFVLFIENKYCIHFSENELVEKKFDTLGDIELAVIQHRKNNI